MAEAGTGRKALFVATVYSHLASFHIPYIKLLQRRGFEVHCAGWGKGRFKARLEAAGAICHDVPFSRNPFHPRNLVALLRLKRLLHREEFALVHTHTPVASALLRIAARWTRTRPVIYTAHGFHFCKGCPALNWLLFYPSERLLARWTDALVTINAEDYARAKRFPVRTRLGAWLIPGIGVDLSRFEKPDGHAPSAIRKELGLPLDSLLLLCVGELNANKNQRQLVEALAELKADFPQVQLVLAGEGPKADELRALAATLGVSDRVHLLGYRDDVPRLMQSADLFVFASKREGLPVAVMEAMASGLPIVATKVRGNRDLVVECETGFLVEVGDATTLARRVAQLLANEELRRSFGRRARERIQAYKLEHALEAMDEIYSAVLGET